MTTHPYTPTNPKTITKQVGAKNSAYNLSIQKEAVKEIRLN